MNAIMPGPLVMDLSSDWKSKIDPSNSGEREEWFAASASDESWKPVCLERYRMTHRNGRYKDAVWYSKEFSLSRDDSGRPLWLVFYLTEGRTTIWLNGKPIGGQVSPPVAGMRNKPWALNITEHVKSGEKLRLVVRCEQIQLPAQVAVGNRNQIAGLAIPIELRHELNESEVKKPSVAEDSPKICMNTAGFLSKSPKYFVVLNAQDQDDEFEVRNYCPSGTTAYRGKLRKGSGDFGSGMVGDFSELTDEGVYIIVCKNAVSEAFFIDDNGLNYPLRMMINHFTSKRCGHTDRGYMEQPCHEYVFRVDNGEPIDLSGGWHQSCDYNKNPLGCSYGMLGLSQLGLSNPVWVDTVADELRWGCQYFQKLVRPDGGVMNGPTAMDGRSANVDDNSPGAMYNTLCGLAMSAQFFKETEEAFSRLCLAKAVSIWNYITRPSRGGETYKFPFGIDPVENEIWNARNFQGSSFDIGDQLFAAMLLYDASGDKHFLESAARCASQLADLQVGGNVHENPAAGCFYDSAKKKEFAVRQVLGMDWGMIGLCAAVEKMPEHPDRDRWLKTLERVADQYALMSQRNPWGLIPLFWFSSPHPGAHPAGSAFYRYFYMADGLNAGILRASVFLTRAYKLLPKPEYLVASARQIDWVLGGNPQQTSFVEGVGQNQPLRVLGRPYMPKVPGAVMTGFQGLPEEDVPCIYGTSVEYDIPDTGMLMWALCDWKKQFGCGQRVERDSGELGGKLRTEKAASSLPEQWTVFAPVNRSFTLEKSQLATIPSVINAGNGTISPRLVKVVDGRLDLNPFVGGTGAQRCAYVFIPISLSEDKSLVFGFGADWWFEAFLDGEHLCDTMINGNLSDGYSSFDHMKRVHLTKGNHLLAIRVISGICGHQLCAGLFPESDKNAK